MWAVTDLKKYMSYILRIDRTIREDWHTQLRYLTPTSNASFYVRVIFYYQHVRGPLS